MARDLWPHLSPRDRRQSVDVRPVRFARRRRRGGISSVTAVERLFKLLTGRLPLGLHRLTRRVRRARLPCSLALCTPAHDLPPLFVRRKRANAVMQPWSHPWSCCCGRVSAPAVGCSRPARALCSAVPGMQLARSRPGDAVAGTGDSAACSAPWMYAVRRSAGADVQTRDRSHGSSR